MTGQVVQFPSPTTWEPWVDARAVARHFGVSQRTVERWQHAGAPSRLVGASRRYRLSAIDAWLGGRAA